ncbi:hypothetical protein OXYTRIMIC_790 [Oxytricha trifallax]|uniref:Uncharacterized protein n=1 Tax=Oxytricha trifallax TaxID=1172189 RepID=A0A073HYX9_9SPIT|nr:hypothetical protein OXYTRIMIC_790 [Oxytricha trifallax]
MNNRSEQDQQISTTIRYTKCNREVYRCLYCLQGKGVVRDYCSRKILSHVKNSHEATLKKLSIYQGFKLQVNRDVSNTQQRCDEMESITPRKKSTIKNKFKKIIQQEAIQVNKGESSHDLELEDDFKDDSSKTVQYSIKQFMEIGEAELNYQNFTKEAEVAKLKQTIIIQNQIITQLINCSQFMNESKGSKNILTQHILQGQDRLKKKQELSKISKKVIQSIEFTGDNIRLKIEEIKSTYSQYGAVQEFLIQEFQQKSLLFFIETFEKYFNEFRISRESQNETQELRLVNIPTLTSKQLKMRDYSKKGTENKFIISL